MKKYKTNIKRCLLGVVAICTGALATEAQTGNHVFEGAEAVAYDAINLATAGAPIEELRQAISVL